MTSVDIETVLAELDIDFDVRGNEACGICPMHLQRTGKPDHSPSWWINLETGQHICFSCQYKGGLLQLICDVKELTVESWGNIRESDYASARIWLSQIADISPDKLAIALKTVPSFVSSQEPAIPMSEARLAVFTDPPLEQLEARRISLAATRAYGILWDPKECSWILPFREPHTGKLLGWQEKGTLTRTFMNHPKGLARSKTLFGLNQLREDVVYLVESPLDCARLYSAGFPGAVAICGSTMNENQVKLIRNTDKVIAAFDNPKIDQAGKGASAQLHTLALKYGLNLSYFNYGDSGKKDPGDMTDVEIAWGIEHAVSSLYGENAYV